MNKIKLCGVSLCTLLAATGANAAGYTCEELIEYTSCSAGYYSGCPDGSVYGTGWCVSDLNDASEDSDEEDCLMGGGDYLGTGCLTADGMEFLDTEDVWLLDGNASLIPQTCTECPVGSICAGGDVDIAVAAPCPAGSYCASVGLSTPSGKCNVGTYSTGGATAATCTSCPATGLKDKSGATVVATTLSAGSTAASACVIGDDVEFQDNKGIWHYKQNCEYFNSFSPIITISSEEECNALAAERPDQQWTWDTIMYADGEDYGMGCVQYDTVEHQGFDFVPQTEYECNRIKNTKWDAEDGFCYCETGYWVLTPTVLHCTDVI